MLKTAAKTIGILFISLGTGTLLLLAVFLLPTERIFNSVAESKNIFTEESNWEPLIPGDKGTQLDNYTDSIMLQNAFYSGTESLVNRAMNVPRLTVQRADFQPRECLIMQLEGKTDGMAVYHYPNYWHGYLVILKPLLLFFNYGEIRILNGILTILFIFAVCRAMAAQKLQKFILPYVVSMILIFPATVMLSMQFVTVFFLLHISMLVMLRWNEAFQKRKLFIYFFLITGILTSFLDFLTYPLVTLGMPLVLFFLLNGKGDTRSDFLDLIRFSVMWGIGYAGMWVGKFAVSSLLLGKNMFREGFDRVVYRSSGEVEGGSVNFLSVFRENLNVFLSKPTVLLIVILVVWYLVKIIKARTDLKEVALRLLPFAALCVYPFCWYFVMKNHSYIHTFYTYRILAISAFAGLSMLAECVGTSQSSGLKPPIQKNGTNRREIRE